MDMGTAMGGPTNRQWLLARRPSGPVSTNDFRWVETPPPTPADGELLVRNLVLSCDPTQRSWMAGRTYLPAVPMGEVVRSLAVGEVLASRCPRFAPGQIVYAMFGRQDYCATAPDLMFPTTRVGSGVSLEAALGVLGLTGLTAYFGLKEIGAARPGEVETILVVAARGRRLHRIDVRASVALGRAVGADELARGDVRQIAVPDGLALGSPDRDRRGEHLRAEREDEPGVFAGSAERLHHQHRVVRVEAAAAQLLGHRRARANSSVAVARCR